MQKVLLTVYWDDLMSLYQIFSFVKNVNICGFSFSFFFSTMVKLLFNV